MGNTEFLMGRFREYYRNAELSLPPRFTRREYGFLFFNRKYFLRHLAFRNKLEIKKFLIENVPRHAYYSTAYYKEPSNKSMEGKGWLGADLIFDLDADHIPETEGMSYREMLGVVKREAQRLVDDFLLNDFGFDEGDLTIAFSGGRGFHIYVRNRDVYTLKSDERREIVSYITGEGMDILDFIDVVQERSKRGGKVRYRYLLYPPDYGGWYGRVTRGILENTRYLRHLYHTYGEEALLREINSVIKNKKFANLLVRDLLKETQDNTKKIDIISQGQRSENLQIFEVLSDKAKDYYLQYLKNKLVIKGEADEPVTTDIHRLIRLIGTLHGKTGFLVKQLTYDEFKEFNPANPRHLLEYVVPDVFREGESRVITHSRVELPFDIAEVDGEECVPDYAAVFLVARGLGDFISRC